MVISDQLNHQQQQQAQHQIATQRLNTALQQQPNHRRSSANNLPSQGNNGNNGVSCNNICNSNSNNFNNNTNSNSTNNGGNINSNVGLVSSGLSAAAAKNQLEQLNTMREALFSQDGWGCQHVNQDTNWEVPSSPEPTNKDPSTGPPLWKPTINNGTDLWESNLRNGGQPTSQPVQKTPWGHTPSSNLGGTWGEDDDGADSNVWTGSTANPNGATNIGVGGVGTSGVTVGSATAQQWGQNSVGVGVGSSGNTSNTATVGLGGVNSGGATTSAGVNVQGTSGNGSSNNNAGNGWGDPRELRSGPIGNPLDIRSVDHRDSLRAASAGDPRDLRMLDPRDPIRGDPRGISGRLNGTSEMWGQHHQITHSQIPALNKIVGPTGSSNVGSTVVSAGGVGIGPSVPNLNNAGNVGAQWGNSQAVVGPKDMNAISSKQVSGWEEPSPPPQRRNIPNYDDGTSLWGQQTRVPGGGAHWKDLSDPMNRNHLIRSTIGNQNPPNPSVVAGISGPNSGLGGGPTGIGAPGNINVPGNLNNPMNTVGPPGRLASNVGGPGVVVGGQHKPDNPLWVHSNSANVTARNPSWGDDGNHNVNATSGSNWVDDKPNTNIGQINSNVGGGNSWNDPTPTWNKNQNKISSGSGWGSTNANDINDINSDWNAHSGLVGKPQQKYGVNVGVSGINLEMLKQSKQYRVLVDTGFKKEDVERALINANMNFDEAGEILKANATIVMENWRRPDEAIGSYPDHTNSVGGFPGRYPTPGAQPTMSFPPNNLLNNMGGSVVGVGGNNPNITTLNSIQPLQVQKYLNQGPHNVTNTPQSMNANPVTFGQNANVAAAAVNAASNSNNQPSAQQLRMLVQQIQLAVHSGYLSSQILNQPLAPATLLLLNQLLTNIKHLQGAQQSARNNANNIQLNVAIAKYKQQIQNLQSQINAQQAIYIKQQQNLQQNPQHPASHPSGYQNTPNPQSRLNQWKLPVLEKDLGSDSTDFSRAPGTTKPTLTASNANNVGTLGLQSDGTWSSGRNIADGWPEPSNDNENKDWSVTQSPATTYTDLVQEFEPGKPWKGSQIKSIEDDPSITPGSVARSPLSINPTPKDADIFANASKNSPTDLPPLTLSSSTWSFNPSSSNQSFSSWSDNSQQCSTAEIWASPISKTSRGPPPGLSSNKTNSATVSGMTTVSNSTITSGNSNGWLVGGGNRAIHTSNTGWSGPNSGWNSNWLLLKNLNAQIDGSTLRTLCMQHGPLITFHLYLNQGIALCKYATREESSKAQMTLNNCVLGNTTICAESPSENEVQNILQHLPQTPNSVLPSSSNGSGNSITNIAGGANTNSGSGNNSGNNGNGNSGLTSNTLPSSGNNGSNINGAAVNIQGQGNNTNPTNAGGNSNNCSSSSAGNTNTSTIGGNSSTWRSNQNQQNQQNQQRPPTGRESDFDYISKFVCSIVDD